MQQSKKWVLFCTVCTLGVRRGVYTPLRCTTRHPCIKACTFLLRRPRQAPLAKRAASFAQPAARECCAAAGWVQQHMADSYRALHDYHCQWVVQVGSWEVETLQGSCPACSCHPVRPCAFGYCHMVFCAVSRPDSLISRSVPALPQMKEMMAAVEARRPLVIAGQPAVHLDLPKVLQHPPLRLDMCSVCANW